jgi:hypothetical protein
MSDTRGSLIRRAAIAACLCFFFVPAASAQLTTPPGFAPKPASADFLTRYDFHLSAAKLLNIDDPRFIWDTHFGGDLDVYDYVNGRASILVDYEAVLGDQIRAFDPTQGNYTLEASGSVRAAGAEIAGVFHHVSRHLGDRPKLFPIAWNVLEARVMGRVVVSGTTADITVGGGRLVQSSTVDYTWTGNLDVLIRRPINERVGVFLRGTGEIFQTDPELSTRGQQQGGKAEAGIRINGRGGVLELFAGYERRIDADPIDGQSHNWGLAGFRLLGT